MGRGKRYSDEFKRAAAARVLGGESVDRVARECGASGHSIRDWVKGAESTSRERPATAAELEEIRQLKRELRRAKEDNEILKKPPRSLPRRADETASDSTAREGAFGACLLSCAGC